MKPNETFDSINPDTFDALLQDYANMVPDKLLELDEQRYHTIPDLLKTQPESAYLTKDQVATLVKWKLSHGKWRPSLQGLVQKNEESVVEEITRSAFKSFTSTKDPTRVKTTINALAKLQGIGPATASLLLSVYDLDNIPFFSDELFRWCLLDEAKGVGWHCDIRYSIKEYLELFGKVHDLRERFVRHYKRELAAVEIEKVAYVLGKRAAGVVAKDGSGKAKRKASALVDDDAKGATDTIPKDDTNVSMNANAIDEAEAGPKKAQSKPPKTKNTGATKKLKTTAAEATAATTRTKRTAK